MDPLHVARSRGEPALDIGDLILIANQRAANASAGVTTSSWSDVNSLVLGDLSSPDWTRVTPSASYGVQTNAGVGPTGIANAYQLNPQASAPATGYLSLYVVAPPGATSLTFSVPMNIALGVTAAIEAWNTGPALVARTLAVGTGQWTTYSVSWSVSAGTTYEVRLVMNEAGVTTAQATALAEPPSVTALGATGLFAQPFVRIHCPNVIMLDNAQPATDAGPLGYRTSAYARLSLSTNVQSFVVEMFSTLPSFPGMAQLLVKLGAPGKPRFFQAIPATVFNALQYQSVSGLPAGSKGIDLVAGATFSPESAMLGTWIRSLFVPLSASVIVLGET